jgi:hypothetical protein
MSMAMGSILTVFFMRNKEGKGTMLSKGRISGGERRREVGQRQSKLWAKAEGLEFNYWNVLGRSVRLIYMYEGSAPSFPGPRNRKLSVLSLECA